MKNGKICILKVVTFGIVKITCRIFNIVVTFVFKPFGTGHEFKRKLFEFIHTDFQDKFSYNKDIIFISSLRAVYGTDSTKNALHGSDSYSSAEREIHFFFPDSK